MYRPVYLPQAVEGLSPWRPLAAPPRVRQLAARHLRRVGAWLARLARLLASPAPRESGRLPLPDIEFCAEAGAPEGALFVNGEYVGRLDVRRL